MRRRALFAGKARRGRRAGAMGCIYNLWLHFGVEEPTDFATYFDVHQGFSGF